MEEFLTNSEEAEWASESIEKMLLALPEEVDAANVSALVIRGLAQLLVAEAGYSPQAIQHLITDSLRDLMEAAA